MKKFVVLLLTLATVGVLGVSAMATEPEELQSVQTLWFTAPEEYEVTLAGTDASEGIVSVIAEGLKNRVERIDISSYNVSVNDVRYYYEVALSQAVDVYWINNVPTVYHYEGQNQAVAIVPRYMTSEQQTTYKAKVDEIVAGMDSSWSDFEKALYLNDYLTTHAKYDYSALSGDVNHVGYTTYELLVNGKGVCQAYTMAYRSLLNAVGIANCTARSESMNHIWNLVQIGGSWYHVDTTWNDPIRTAMKTDPSAPDFLGSARHGYFLLSDGAIRTEDKTQARYDTHQDWVAAPRDTVCDSMTYDTWYGNTVEKPFVCLNDTWYFIQKTQNESGTDSYALYATENAGDTETLGQCTLVRNLNHLRWFYMKIMDQEIFITGFSTLSRYAGKLVYHDGTTIYSYDPDTQKESKLLDLTETGEVLWLYGLVIDGNQASCLLSQNYEYTGYQSIKKILLPYEAADVGDYSVCQVDGTLYVRQDAESGLLVLAQYDVSGRMIKLQTTSTQNGALYADIPESGYLKIFALDASHAPRCAVRTVSTESA